MERKNVHVDTVMRVMPTVMASVRNILSGMTNEKPTATTYSRRNVLSSWGAKENKRGNASFPFRPVRYLVFRDEMRRDAYVPYRQNRKERIERKDKIQKEVVNRFLL